MVNLAVQRDMLALQVFYFALALIIVGVGFLKANITALVSFLYPGDDPRRDSGFTLFQMGISSGAMAAALVCGYLGQNFGWKYGFGVAGIGMMAGLLIFLRGQKYLIDSKDYSTRIRFGSPGIVEFGSNVPLYSGVVFAVLAAYSLLKYTAVGAIFLGVLSILVFGGLIVFLIFKCDNIERDKMLAVLTFLGFIILFFVMVEQAGASLVLFADRNVDRVFLTVEFHASQLFAFLPGSLIILAPVMAWLWVALSRHNLNPSTPIKCGIGIIFTAMGFAGLTYGALMSADGMVSMSWLILAYVFMAMGDLWIAPIALSIITKLSAPKMAGMMVGVYLLAVSVGSYFAALLAQIAVSNETLIQTLPTQPTLEGFITLFAILAFGGIFFGVIIILTTPILRKKMHGLH